MNITEYVKKKDFLICVDSDGCAMDTMDIKHIKCFGPYPERSRASDAPVRQ